MIRVLKSSASFKAWQEMASAKGWRVVTPDGSAFVEIYFS